MSGKLFFIIFLVITSWSVNAVPIQPRVITQKTIIDATAVASVCRVMVDAGNSGGNHIVFDTYNKSTGEPVTGKNFTLWLFEEGSTIPGCTAFMMAPVATVSFGNAGQMDQQGVITRGAGDGIRIDVRALDEQADYHGIMTVNKASVNYPSSFVSSGKLRYSAMPVNLEKAAAGRYHGTLSFVLSYP